MNITINTENARTDAAQIDKIVNSIADDMKTLNDVFKANIPSGIDTAWSNEVLENWNSYYTEEIPEAMNEMKLSAANLRAAVEQAETYSTSNM